MLTLRKTALYGCGIALISCGSGPSALDDDDPRAGGDLSDFFIAVALCADSQGPDCSSLRLGDEHLTTSSPAQGKLYACAPGNPNAPGSIASRITWIDRSSGTWNLLEKPFLPQGGFSPGIGSTSVSESGGVRTVTVTNLPVDGRIGDWPMTQYPLLSAIDANPGVPAAQVYTFQLPMAPVENAVPTCTSLGPIGVTLNGVVLYNAIDARGNDALAHEIVDAFGGHPAMTDYHYHFLPERLDAAQMADGHSELVGYVRDGFGLYGYLGVGGVELSNVDLDECHGHDHAPIGYHYHATIEYPYTVGCYRGSPVDAGRTSLSMAEATIGDVRAVLQDAELRFLRGMVAHHLQALEMTELAGRHAVSAAVREMAERMEIAQRHEIALMQSWLSAASIASAPEEEQPEERAMGLMPGMLTPEQMALLRRARGPEFDRTFLRLMTRHHEGALVMTEELLAASGDAGSSGALRLAEDIEGVQRAEIERMRWALGDAR